MFPALFAEHPSRLFAEHPRQKHRGFFDIFFPERDKLGEHGGQEYLKLAS